MLKTCHWPVFFDAINCPQNCLDWYPGFWSGVMSIGLFATRNFEDQQLWNQ